MNLLKINPKSPFLLFLTKGTEYPKHDFGRAELYEKGSLDRLRSILQGLEKAFLMEGYSRDSRSTRYHLIMKRNGTTIVIELVAHDIWKER